MRLRVQAVGNEEVLAFLGYALPEVYGYLLHRTHDRATAEDLTSDTMLAAVRTCRREEPETLTVAWLVGIARHKLVDHWRREALVRRHLVLIAQSQRSVTTPLEDNAAPDPCRARDALALLNPSQRAALVLRHVDGLSVPEVARLVDRSVHATETLLTRARSAFRLRYDEIGDRDD